MADQAKKLRQLMAEKEDSEIAVEEIDDIEIEEIERIEEEETEEINEIDNEIKEIEETEEAPIEKVEEITKLSSRVITITSGKGGVGKSNFAVNLAIQLSKLGKRVLVIDADFGLANVEVLMGINPEYNLSAVMDGSKKITDIIVDGPEGIKIISGGSGLSKLANMTEEEIIFLIKNFNLLDKMSDIILIDTGAGISKTVIDFISASEETIIVTTPEPTSITDDYAIIKTINEKEGESPDISILVNRVENNREGELIFKKLKDVSKKFLDVDIDSIGFLPADKYLIRAVKSQEPVSILYPNAPVVKSIENISLELINKDEIVEKNTGLKGFLSKFINKVFS